MIAGRVEKAEDFRKDKVYGYSYEYIREHGEPEENTINVKIDGELKLTQDEINKMFPNQELLLNILKCRDLDDIFTFDLAQVLYYKCKSPQTWEESMNLNEANNVRTYLAYRTYDHRMDGDVLWF